MGPRIRSGFRRAAPASLTPRKRLKIIEKSKAERGEVKEEEE